MLEFEVNKEYKKELVKICKCIYEGNLKEKEYNLDELIKYVPNYPKCRICGKPIVYENMIVRLNHLGTKLRIKVPKYYNHHFDNYNFTLNKCFNCVKKEFKDDLPSMQRYLFNLRLKWAKFIYDIPTEIHKIIRQGNAVTLKNLVNKYGEIEGKKRFESYCKKCAYTNSFKYKKEAHGWSKEDFDAYNKSRGVTKENLIRRHGEKKGLEIWDNYIKQQRLTKSWDYIVEKHGIERAKEINASHAVTLENLIKKYGEKEGTMRWNKFITTSNKFYSKISQELFKSLDEIIKKKSYFATKNTEFSIYDKNTNRVYLLDYYIPELKICVEFDGDLFHANPSKFKNDDRPNPYNKELTAQDIWENDKIKHKIIENKGIKVVRIWESEYTDKNFNILDFIQNKMKIKLDKTIL